MAEFYEDKEVRSVEKTEDKMPAGTPIVKVVFTDDSVELMSEVRFNTMKSAEATDATKSREALTKKVGSQLYGILVEYGLRLNEIDPCFDQAVQLTNNVVEQAEKVMWKVLSGKHRTLKQVNDVLLEHYANTESKTDSDATAS